MGMNARITALEETVAHLSKVVEELSDVIARQDREIDRLSHRVTMLMEREADRELDTGGAIPLADQKPPHW
jgi:SlyX protein